MTSEQQDLWKALDGYFNLFCGSSKFLSRLAGENRWRPSFAARVLDEYKKFLFLAKESDHAVTPSASIDKAWHLHLVHTESYWDEFCPKVLKMSLHHSPATGTGGEDALFADNFAKTLSSYRLFFGDYPRDIWLNRNRTVPFLRCGQEKWAALAGGVTAGLLALFYWQVVIVPDHFIWPIDLGIFLLFAGNIGTLIYAMTARESRSGKDRWHGGSCSSGGCTTDPGHGDSGGGHSCSGGGHGCGGGH